MEIIGRLIMMVLLLVAASLAGVVCAAFVALLLHFRKGLRLKPCLIAGSFPPVTMAYWLGCLVVSSVLSGVIGTPDLVFADIHEKLPNGYAIEALDKMPECGHIQKAGESSIQIAWVRSLQVEGPYVLGQYDYTYFPRTPEEVGRDYFLFDTRSGRIANFGTQDELENAAKVKIHLTPTESFRGPRSAVQNITTAMFVLITLVPPLVVGLWLVFRFVVPLRGREIPIQGELN